MFKKKIFVGVVVICLMFTSMFSNISVVTATQYVPLQSSIFEVDNLLYSDSLDGIFGTDFINSSRINVEYDNPIIVSEQIIDASNGTNRRLTIHTDVTIESKFDINNILNLNRKELEVCWLLIDGHPLYTQYSNDLLSLSGQSTDIDGILQFDLKYDLSKYVVVSSNSLIKDSQELNMPSSLLRTPAPIFPAMENIYPAKNTIYDNIYGVAELPYYFIVNVNKTLQDASADFSVTTIVGNSLSVYTDIDLKGKFITSVDEYQMINQRCDGFRTIEYADDGSYTSTWSIPTDFYSYDLVQNLFNVVNNAMIENVGRTITVETVVDLSIIDPSNIISYIDIVDETYVNDEGEIVDDAYLDENGDVIDANGNTLNIFEANSAVIFGVGAIVTLGVLGTIYVFIKKK
jgi:hypothetical protein